MQITRGDIVLDPISHKFGVVNGMYYYFGRKPDTLSFSTQYREEKLVPVKQCKYMGSDWKEAWINLANAGVKDWRIKREALPMCNCNGFQTQSTCTNCEPTDADLDAALAEEMREEYVQALEESGSLLSDIVKDKSLEYRKGVIEGILAVQQFRGFKLGGVEWELFRTDVEEWERFETDKDIQTNLMVAVHLPYALEEWAAGTQ